MPFPPTDPHPALVPFSPAARRGLTVFGSPATLVLVPERARRPGLAAANRPALSRSPATRIVAEEALWRSDSLVLTPNRHPFAESQRILWMAGPAREPDFAFWLAAGTWAAATGGSALLNTVGAAATIARAHAHLVPSRLPFLTGLPTGPCMVDLIELPAGCTLVQKQVPFCLLGVTGPVAGRAQALLLLAEARLTAAWNVVLDNDTAWLMPRQLETPAPDFPHALGAAEVWGQWCYTDAAAYAAATTADLERALQRAGTPPGV